MILSDASDRKNTLFSISNNKSQKIMEKEKITIIITYDDENKFGSSKRKIDVYGVGNNEKEELLFSETETVARSFGNTKSGVAGAVNLLYGLLFDHSNTHYYVNDEYRILNVMADKLKCRTAYNGEKCGCVGKRFNLLRKLRLKMLQLKVKFLNVLK